MDPQILSLIWLLYRDIESYVATESSVFVTGFYRSIQFFVATYSLSLFLGSVATDFDNVAIEFLSSSVVLVVTRMSCVATQNLLHPAPYTLMPLETVTT